MPWTTPNWHGAYGFGTNGKLRHGMFELCCAVNERQAALGITKTVFFKADGSQSSDISFSSLLGIRAAGSGYRTNLERIYSAIRAMASSFNQSGTTRDKLTVGLVESEIGASLSPTILGQRVAEDTLYQVAQDALDELIFISKDQGLTGSAVKGSGYFAFSGSYRSGVSDPPVGGEYNSAQDAWDNRLAYSTGGTYSGSGAGVGYYDTGFLFGTEYDAYEQEGSQDVEIDFSAFGFPGYSVSAWYRIVTSNTLSVSFDWDFAGASGSASGSSDAWYSGNNLDLENPNSFSLDVPMPSTQPSSGLALGDIQSVSITPQTCTAVINISGILSDQ
jgi:hypothetical protein